MPRSTGADRTDGGLTSSWPGGQPPSYWQAQPDFYISSAGSDSADGLSSATPLATPEEYALRVLGTPSVDQTIHFVGDYTGDVYIFNLNDPITGPFTFVEGTETILLDNIAVTSTTPTASATTGAQTTISSVTIPVSWTASALVGNLLIGKTGTITGFAMVVEADLGGGGHQARVTQPTDIDANTIEPTAGDTCKAVSYSQLTNVTVRGGVYLTKVSTIGVVRQFDGAWSWACQHTPTNMDLVGYATAMLASTFTSGSSLAISDLTTLQCCWFPNGLTTTGGQVASALTLAGSGFGSQLMLKGADRCVLTSYGPDTTAGAHFFGVANPIVLTYGAYLDATSAIPYGTGNTGTGIAVKQSEVLLGITDPNLGGVTDSITLDGAAFATSAVTSAGAIESGGSRVSVFNSSVPGLNIPSLAMDCAIRAGALRP